MTQRRRPRPLPGGDSHAPPAHRVDFARIHRHETYEAVTPDGWTLTLSRYAPVPQPWAQPVLGTPVLLVHGFSQNRHAWTTGDMVKQLVYYGFDVHILELRGHGLSGRRRQRELADAGVRPLPADWDYRWDFPDYWIHDAPAAVEAVKARTGAARIAYCGHSMGGLIGYALAARRDDLLCLATVGSPVEVGAESAWLRLASRGDAFLPALQGAVRAYERGRGRLERLPGLGARLPRLHAEIFPSDLILGTVYRSFLFAHERMPWLMPRAFRLFNPDRARPEDVKWLLEIGQEKEPIAVTRTFLQWIRRRELRCYRTGFDIRAGIEEIGIPVLIFFGTEDILAGEQSTRPAYARLDSPHVAWRELPGGGHIDITMGYGTRGVARELAETVAGLGA